LEGSPRDLRKSATKRDFLATKPNAWEVKMLRSDLSILIVAFLFALPLIAGSPTSKADEENSYDYNEEEDEAGAPGESRGEGMPVEQAVLQNPKFVTEGQNVLVNEGDNIRLPCIVDRLEGFVMLWKKGNDIITVASQIIDKRVRLDEVKNGNYLIIGQSTPEDSGEYKCQISAYNPTELTHTVRIRTSPVIRTTPEKELVAVAGSSVTLNCRVESGSPQPTVEWKREGDDKALESDGGVLTINKVTRHMGGVYTCLADNGFGPQPVTKAVKLEVHYAPHISVEHPRLETGYGSSQELVCMVHAHPKAKVTWLKGGEPIDTNMPDVVEHSVKHRHSLTLLSVSSDKLGDYQCKAENDVGEALKTITVAGHASPAVVLSPTNGDQSNEYTLQWSASSLSAIQMFRVEVQREGQAMEDEAWVVNEVETEDENEEEEEDDEGLGERKREARVFHGSLTMKDLQPATRYKVRVASRNAFGFNNPEEVFVFATKGAEPWQQPSVLAASSPSLFPSSILSFIIVILPLFLAQ